MKSEKQTWFCGKCTKEYGNEEDALFCCEEWKLKNEAITEEQLRKYKEKKKDVRKEIKNLDSNITNVVSRNDGTLEVYVKKQSESTKRSVLGFLSQRCLENHFVKVDFHEIAKAEEEEEEEGKKEHFESVLRQQKMLAEMEKKQEEQLPSSHVKKHMISIKRKISQKTKRIQTLKEELGKLESRLNFWDKELEIQILKERKETAEEEEEEVVVKEVALSEEDDYFVNFFSEKKGINGFDFTTVEGNHVFDYCYTKEDILKIILGFSSEIKKKIREKFVHIDFNNGDVNPFIEYLMLGYCREQIKKTLKEYQEGKNGK